MASSTSETTPSRSATVDGWTINLPTLDAAVTAIIQAAKSKASFTCFTLNLDHLVKLRKSASFRDVYQAARFVTADGEPIAVLARRQWPQVRRTTGADLFIPLCKAAADADIKVYLFGTSPEVLQDTANHLDKLTAGKLTIAGMESPPLGFDGSSTVADTVIERIRQSGAGLCFVLLGAPKQEIFSNRAVQAGVECGFLGFGAAADFISGHVKRAPPLLRRTGLEWLWRLSQQPRHLAHRYLVGALLLARIEAGYWLGWDRKPP